MSPAIASTPNVTITSPAFVNASGRTPEENRHVARQVACETEQAVLTMVGADDLPQTEVTRERGADRGVILYQPGKPAPFGAERYAFQKKGLFTSRKG